MIIDQQQAGAKLDRALAETIRTYLKPPPRLSVSEWADRYRYLPDTSAEPGRWKTSRTPYLREIMDTVSELHVEEVVFMKPAQCGGSEALLNILGFFVHQDPAPVLFVQISSGEAAKFSKERIAPMIADTPVLSDLVGAARTRDSSNTIESKDFPGGHLGIVGANAPAGLRSRPRRVLLFDEVDGYPPSAGNEGDPIGLAEKRTTTFWNRKKVKISTPTLEDLSRIADALSDCDEVRTYHVPCPECGELQELRFGGKDLPYGLKWDRGSNGEHLPETAYYVCEHCSSIIQERSKVRMIRDEKAGGSARWIAEEPHPRPTRVGFRLNGLYSPWLRWSQIVQEWVDAQGNPTKMQVFVNTRLGETWDQSGGVVESGPLYARREEYGPDPVPEGVVVLTAGVDVQADRLEMEIVGWGVGEESWSVQYLRVPGDPSVGGGVWKQLDDVLAQTYQHPLGARIRISACCVDSGYLTQQVYKYAKDRRAQNVWAVKGFDGPGRPIMDRPSRRTRTKVPLYPVGTDAAKTQIYGRLAIEEPGPGYCHFPARPPYDEEFFRQLTSEKVVLRQTTGNQLKRLWVRRPGRRAEVLDCRVYATAALEGLVAAGVRLRQIAAQLRGEFSPPRRRIRQRGVE